jgi:hypothetical protein|tara:strand:+ start:212 stop:406 length:195 start_codon:yes stop_codon:yes gene_type:complete
MIPTVIETIMLTANASQTSGSSKIISYHFNVKCPKGRLGKRSELKEKTKLARMGEKTKKNTIIM